MEPVQASPVHIAVQAMPETFITKDKGNGLLWSLALVLVSMNESLQE